MKFIKQLLNLCLGLLLFRPFLKSKIFIFCYHDISDTDAPHHSTYYSTPRDVFKKHIEFIQKNFEIISIENLKEKHLLDKNKRYAIITFDDGFNTVLTEAHPLLSKKNIPYTIFVNKMAIEENQLWLSNLVLNKNDKQYLNFFYDSYFINKSEKEHSDFVEGNFASAIDNINYALLKTDKEKQKNKIYSNIKELNNVLKTSNIITIGNHTASHFNLAKCSAALQYETISTNHQYVDSRLNINMNHFAIPFGKKQHFTDETLSILSENNYSYIYSTNPSYVNINDDNMMSVFPRIGITNQSINELIFYINRTLLKKINL